MASEKFYLRDEKHTTVGNKVVDKKDVLYFQFPKTGFDSHATRKHTEDFAVAYEAFKAEHKSFKTDWEGEEVVVAPASLDPKAEAIGVIQSKAQDPKDEVESSEKDEAVIIREKSAKKAK